MSTSQIEEAAEHYKKFCEALGIDLTKPDTLDTPTRVARLMLNEFLVGERERPFNFTTFPYKEVNHGQLVTETGIRFVSLCAHHHLPIIGYAHVCYIPREKLAGLSKIPRLVEWRAARPTIQEQLTQDILQTLQYYLDPHYIGVKLIAVHECMACRGVRSYESRTHTTALWCSNGDYTAYEGTKAEFQANIEEWYRARGVL